jgi:hypothetical protein
MRSTLEHTGANQPSPLPEIQLHEELSRCSLEQPLSVGFEDLTIQVPYEIDPLLFRTAAESPYFSQYFSSAARAADYDENRRTPSGNDDFQPFIIGFTQPLLAFRL